MLSNMLLGAITNNDVPAHITKEERINDYKILKVEFSGHSYIIFHNTWNGRQTVMHDTDCGCIRRAIEEVKKGK